MQVYVIYDNTGSVHAVRYGEDQTTPREIQGTYQDIPEGALITGVDTSDPNRPKILFTPPEKSKLEKEVNDLNTQISHLSKISGIGVEIKILNQLSIEELKEAKRAEVNAACGQIICNGITVELSTGFEHFSLSQTDQLNLFGLQAQIASGTQEIIYHADGQPCRFYPASDIALLIEKAMFHASYHTTYANSLRTWIDSVETAEELQDIYYGADIPVEYQSEVLKAYLAQITAINDGAE